MTTQPPLHATLASNRTLARARGGDDLFLAARLTADPPPQRAGDARPALNISLVLDRSGSMQGAKIDRAREAAIFAVAQLEPTDAVGVVAYDHAVEIATPSTMATPAAREAARRALSGYQARGNTDLHGGWVAGLQQIASQRDALGAAALHRCFLLTDGLANQGVTDPDALVAVARAWRERGVTTTTFGVGADFNELLLEAIADAGGGHFHFIAEPADIPNFFKGELGELQQVMARDITLELWGGTERAGATTPATFTSLNRFALETDAAGVARTTVGDLFGGGERVIVARVKYPHGERGATLTLHGRVTARTAANDATFTLDLPPITFTYDLDAAVDAAPQDAAVMSEVALLVAAQARDEANRLGRAGDVVGSAMALNVALGQMAPFAAFSAPLRHEIADMELLAELEARGATSELHRKGSHSRSYLQRHSQPDYASPPPTPEEPPKAP